MSFNLTTEKWIPVVDHSHKIYDISLIELFENWSSFREIQANNPPTTFALYRFLLAIIHRVYQGPTDVDHWEGIKEDDGKKVVQYLKDKFDCFDLLHPQKPFMQDMTITEDNSGKIYQAAEIHGNNTSTVFCHQHQWSGYGLSIPEGARLVVRLANFDVGGKKTGATDSAATIPTMDSANVLIQGQNLALTLLLNLMNYNTELEIPSPIKGEDLPAWERITEKAKEKIPSGYIDYLTFQWRRIRLFVDEEKAIKIAVHPGDRLPKEIPALTWECAIAYKKSKKGGFLPVKLDLRRSLWRDSHCFLRSSDEVICPRILQWRAELKSEELICDSVNLQIFGLSVDNAKPLGWIRENFSAPIQFLTERQLWQSLTQAIKITEDHQQRIFRSFQGSPYYALAEVLGDKTNADKFAKNLDGESRYWASLDHKFAELLKKLPKDKKTLADGTLLYGAIELPKWTETVQKSARDAFTESIQSIRNYEARAKALSVLNNQLQKLGGQKDENSPKAKVSRKKKINLLQEE